MYNISYNFFLTNSNIFKESRACSKIPKNTLESFHLSAYNLPTSKTKLTMKISLYYNEMENELHLRSFPFLLSLSIFEG